MNETREGAKGQMGEGAQRRPQSKRVGQAEEQAPGKAQAAKHHQNTRKSLGAQQPPQPPPHNPPRHAPPHRSQASNSKRATLSSNRQPRQARINTASCQLDLTGLQRLGLIHRRWLHHNSQQHAAVQEEKAREAGCK